MPHSDAPTQTPMSMTQARALMSQGRLTAEALLRHYLDRIEAREATIRAWAHLNVDAAVQAARDCDGRPPSGLLHGIPIGIKDVIDTADMPTACGSPIYTGHQPASDAWCVTALRQAGAIILGKTTTSEFAHTRPPATRNPHNPAHTPGGSSSGSAAAVADGMIPAALATQTGGSTIRPAAYCGIVGFKPSFGLINRAGVKPVAESLDTIGLMAHTVDDIALLMQVLVHDSLVLPVAPSTPPRIGIVRTPYWSQLDDATRTRLDEIAGRLAGQGAQLTEIDLAGALRDSYDAQRIIMNYEAARALHYEYRHHKDALSPALRLQLETGQAHAFSTYQETLSCVQAARMSFDEIMTTCDLVLTPAAPGAAPQGISRSGESIVNRNWTALGVPCITLPAGHDPEGLPLGVQLVGRSGQDMTLLRWARWVESLCSDHSSPC